MTNQKKDKLSEAFDEISWEHLEEALKIRNGEAKPETAGMFYMRHADRMVAVLCVAALLLAATVQLVRNLSGNHAGGAGSEESPFISAEESKEEGITESDGTAEEENTTEDRSITEDEHTAEHSAEHTSNISEDWIEEAWDLFDDLDAEKAPETSIWAYTGFVDSMDTYGALCPAADCDGDGTTDRVYIYSEAAYLFFGNGEMLYLGDVSANYAIEVKYADMTGNGVNEIIFLRYLHPADSGDQVFLDIFEKNGTLWESMEYPWMELSCELEGDKIIYTQPQTGFRAETDSDVLVNGDELFSVDLSNVTEAGSADSVRIAEKNGKICLYIAASVGNRWYYTEIYWCLTYDGEWKITNIFMPEARVLENGGILADGFEVLCTQGSLWGIGPAIYECINSFEENWQGTMSSIAYDGASEEASEAVLLSVQAMTEGELRQLSCRIKKNGSKYEVDEWSETVPLETAPTTMR